LVEEYGPIATTDNFGDIMAELGMGVLLQEQLDEIFEDLDAKKTHPDGIHIGSDLFNWS
jgi:hypothetical protein